MLSHQIDGETVYAALDDYFGERFDDSVVARLRAPIPKDQLEAFSDFYLDRFDKDSIKRDEQGRSDRSGSLLRPLWRSPFTFKGNSWTPTIADVRFRNLVTVSSSVVVDARMNPYSRYLSQDEHRRAEWFGSIRRPIDWFNPHFGLLSRLIDLASFRELFEIGAIEVFDSGDWSLFDQSLAHPPRRSDHDDDDPRLGLQLWEALLNSEAGNGSVHLMDEEEREYISSPFASGEPGLVPTQAPRLLDLAELNPPSFASIEVPEIVALRRSSEAYAEWRNALSTVHTSLMSLDEGEESEARLIVADMLQPRINALVAEVKSSSLRERIKSSTRTLSFSAIGAGAGVVAGGNPASAITGAAVTGFVGAFYEYLASLKDRRSGKALLTHMSALRDAIAQDVGL